MEGYITIHRKILDWEWYGDPNTFRVFVHLLITANYKDGRYQGYEVKRGQVIFGYSSLAKTLGISVQSVRTSISKLKSTGELAVQVTNRFSIGTLVNYDVYQQNGKELTGKLTVEPTVSQQSTNSQLTPSNKVIKKEGKKEDVYARVMEAVDLAISQAQNTEYAKYCDRYRKMYEYIVEEDGIHLLKLQYSVMNVQQYADMQRTCSKEGYQSVKDVIDIMLNKPGYFTGKRAPKTLNKTIMQWAKPKN